MVSYLTVSVRGIPKVQIGTLTFQRATIALNSKNQVLIGEQKKFSYFSVQNVYVSVSFFALFSVHDFPALIKIGPP